MINRYSCPSTSIKFILQLGSVFVTKNEERKCKFICITIILKHTIRDCFTKLKVHVYYIFPVIITHILLLGGFCCAINIVIPKSKLKSVLSLTNRYLCPSRTIIFIIWHGNVVVTDRLVVWEAVVESKTSIRMSVCLASFQYTVAELWSWDLGFQNMTEWWNLIDFNANGSQRCRFTYFKVPRLYPDSLN